MRASLLFLAASSLAAASAVAAPPMPPVVEFEGGIGVDPVTNAGPNTNVVRTVLPGGVHWVIRKLEATVFPDGTIAAKGKGVLFGAGENIGTRGGVANVVLTLACGPVATPTLRTTAPTPLDLAGNFKVEGPLLVDGTATLAGAFSSCPNPVLLVRNAGGARNWFAAGIPKLDD